MKIRNKGSKIINIGTTILMPDASMDINEATLKLPAIQAFIAKGLLETDESEAAFQKAVEEAAARKLEEDAKVKAEAEAKAKAEAEKAAAEVQAAFDFSAASMPSTPTKTKVKKRIQITNPQGFLQVYQMWFTREGINMSMEDLEKVHKKMITYCEKVVNKDGEQIQSAFVKYVDDVTAK